MKKGAALPFRKQRSQRYCSRLRLSRKQGTHIQYASSAFRNRIQIQDSIAMCRHVLYSGIVSN